MIKGKYIVKSNGKIIAEKDNIITTNGFYMINRHLVRSSIEWAGSLAIGAMSNATSISDKELYFEIDRMPITLKSYAKMSPKYIITNKQLTSSTSTATLRFTSITTPILANGYKVQIAGVDSTFNGTYTLTSYSVITPPSLNTAGVYQIQYTKAYGSDVASTAVSSNTAILSVLTDGLGTSIYNNEIILKASLDPTLSAIIYEAGVLPINVKQANNATIKNITGFSEQSTSDSSLSQWVSSSTSLPTSLLGQAIINGTSLTQQAGYTWYNGTANVTLNVGNTNGLKVGSSVYINGTTAASGSTLAPSGTGTVLQINGNYQLIVTMGSSNSTGSTQYGYGGTVSLNTSALAQTSSYGQFNVKLNSAETLTISNINIDASQFTSSDSLLLLYYSPSASNSTSITINLSDNNNASSPFVCSATNLVTSVGLNIARIPLPSTFPSTGISINSIAVNLLTGGPSYIILDALKLITNDYWTGHPYAGISTLTNAVGSGTYITFTTSSSHNFSAGNTVVITGAAPYNGTYTISSVPSKNTFLVLSTTTGSVTLTAPSQAVSSTTVIMPPEYQLVSRSLFTNPIIKTTGQQMDIEYHLQVT